MDLPTSNPSAPLSESNSDKDSGLSRRKVLAGAGATGLCVAAGAAYLATQPTVRTEVQRRAAAQTQALALGEMDRWHRLVGTEFRAAGLRLNLAGVRPLTSVGRRPANVARDRAFLVVFDVRGGQQMAGNLIYAMTAPGHAPLDIFITNAPTPEFPNRMHAVFN